MEKIYLIFYETRHNGNAVSFVTEKKVKKWAKGKYEGLAIPCLAHFNPKYKVLYCPNVEDLDSTIVNEIVLNEYPTKGSVKILRKSLKIGGCAFEY